MAYINTGTVDTDPSLTEQMTPGMGVDIPSIRPTPRQAQARNEGIIEGTRWVEPTESALKDAMLQYQGYQIAQRPDIFRNTPPVQYTSPLEKIIAKRGGKGAYTDSLEFTSDVMAAIKESLTERGIDPQSEQGRQMFQTALSEADAVKNKMGLVRAPSENDLQVVGKSVFNKVTQKWHLNPLEESELQLNNQALDSLGNKKPTTPFTDRYSQLSEPSLTLDGKPRPVAVAPSSATPNQDQYQKMTDALNANPLLARSPVWQKQYEATEKAADFEAKRQDKAQDLELKKQDRLDKEQERAEKKHAAEMKKMEGKLGEKFAAEKQMRMLDAVDMLLPRVNRSTVGIGEITSDIWESPALDFKNDLDFLKANIGFNELQEMRNASKTGGALGQVSDREITLLTSSLRGLNQKQSPDSFKKNLEGIKESLLRWQKAKDEDTKRIMDTGNRVRVINVATGKPATIPADQLDAAIQAGKVTAIK